MTPGTAKAKGRATENQAIAWLRARGWVNAERRRLQGVDDQGDVAGIPGICIEVKSAAAWAPVRWLRECALETLNSKSEIGFVMARPKGGVDVEDWVVMMSPAMLHKLLDQAGWTPATNDAVLYNFTVQDEIPTERGIQVQ